ncbi:unnamed protein product [Onchocerca ochengi]|uniref:Calpain_III domain-containing protein n=1 Tax=Onchocerca ochengi TaxID=42157 RepID=A0A182EMW6_ONCOC|nr:unnamed protein product [Onchocerca ochengi]VDM92930.1 unnamed protein product [Onchocerca ochengi]
MSVWIRDQLDNPNVTKQVKSRLRTKSIIEKARLIVIASARDILVPGQSTDFGCYMPTPMIVNRCAKLVTPAYYPANKAFTTNLLFTAPSHLCPQEIIDLKTSIVKSNTISMKWDKAAKLINMKDKVSKETFAITSETTIMNIVHRGGSSGSFIHEVPAYSQWVNGDSAIIVPEGTKATLVILADDYGREATMESFEYPLFEVMDDVSSDFSLFLYTRPLEPGVYRVGIDQELGGRYIAIIMAEFSQYSIGYVAAINLHRIPPPIFLEYSSTASLTTTELTTTPLIVSTMTTVTTTQTASLVVLSNNLFAICICFIIYRESKQ